MDSAERLDSLRVARRRQRVPETVAVWPRVARPQYEPGAPEGWWRHAERSASRVASREPVVPARARVKVAFALAPGFLRLAVRLRPACPKPSAGSLRVAFARPPDVSKSCAKPYAR